VEQFQGVQMQLKKVKINDSITAKESILMAKKWKL